MKDKMFNIDEYQDLLNANSERLFLNILEAHFRAKHITKYMYLFLPADSRFNTEMIEFHHYGYEKAPETLKRVSAFIHSPHGAKFTKYTTSGMLKPFYENSDVLKADLVQDNNVDISYPDEIGRCLYVPVHAGGFNTGLFFLNGDLKTSKFFDNPRSTQVMCQMLHQRYCELRLQKNSDAVNLTEREDEILNWVAQGKSNSVIGEVIGMSKHTVDGHLRAIYSKLSVSDRTSAAVKACELGLLHP